MDDTRTAFRTCPLCEATCGLEITLRDSQIVRIRGDRKDVFSRGFVCPKGSTLKQLHDDPDRLRRPEIRRNGSRRNVSWEEAFVEIEARLTPIMEKHGRDAVALYLGNPNVHSMAGTLYVKPFVKAVGTRNVFTASTVDQMPKHVTSGYMFGKPGTIAVPDIDRTDYLLMLGADPWESNGSLATAPDFPGRIEALRHRGGRFVVVDPRRSRTAEEADEHLFIRPGTDALFLAALVNVLFSEQLVTVGRLDGLVAGVDEVAVAVAPFTPQAVANATGIDATITARIAREMAGAPTAVAYGRMGTHTAEFGTLASWLVDVLNTLTGNLDSVGGAMFPYAAHDRIRSGPGGRGFVTGRWTSRVRGLPEVLGEVPVASLADEILTPGEGQVRALVTIAGNPVLSTPDASRLDTALESLELMVSVDPYRNETTRHADVILPPETALERSHYDFAFYGLSVRNIANYSPPVLDLPAEAAPEWQILAKLAAIASGYGAATPAEVVDDFLIGQLVAKEVGSSSSPIAGRDPDEIIAALEPEVGPERILDFMVRTGPYGEGFGADPDGLTLERLRLHPHGIDLGPLEPAFPPALQTASGKVEVAPQPIVDDIARLETTLRRLDDAERNGEMLLVGRRQLRSNNSWMHNVGVLVSGKPRCTLLIHPADAARLGLSQSDDVDVTSAVGKLTAPLQVSDTMMPGVVSLPHGWGHDLEGARLSIASEHAGVNANVLSDAGLLDAVSGNAVLNGIPVTVTKG